MECTQADFCMKRTLLLLILILWSRPSADRAQAQNPTSKDPAFAYLRNVVRIKARMKTGESKQGFGFIVGEGSDQLYIVTANHVVRGESPEEIDKNPTVIFFQDAGTEYRSDLLGTELPRQEGDLAVLRVGSPPTKIAWNTNAAAKDPVERGTDVWFVGRMGDWYVPAQAGKVNGIKVNGTILVDALPVFPGTSGAPLISENGIVGMITTDGGGRAFTEATPLAQIRRAMDQWHYPWTLAVVDGTNETYRSKLRLTSKTFFETSDLSAICGSEFGEGANVADWSDVLELWNRRGRAIVDDIGLAPMQRALVTYDGQRIYHGIGAIAGTPPRRHYFIERHDGQKPSDFLAHTEIGQHLISLGSWYDMNVPVLCRTEQPSQSLCSPRIAVQILTPPLEIDRARATKINVEVELHGCKASVHPTEQQVVRPEIHFFHPEDKDTATAIAADLGKTLDLDVVLVLQDYPAPSGSIDIVLDRTPAPNSSSRGSLSLCPHGSIVQILSKSRDNARAIRIQNALRGQNCLAAIHPTKQRVTQDELRFFHDDDEGTANTIVKYLREQLGFTIEIVSTEFKADEHAFDLVLTGKR
jgi:hypothetical protein